MPSNELDTAFELLQKIRWGGMNTPPAAGMWERDGDNAKKIFGDTEAAAGFVHGYMRRSLTWDEKDPTAFKVGGAHRVTLERLPKRAGSFFSPHLVTIPLETLHIPGLQFRLDEEMRLYGPTGNNELTLPPLPPEVRRRINHTAEIAAARIAKINKKFGLE